MVLLYGTQLVYSDQKSAKGIVYNSLSLTMGCTLSLIQNLRVFGIRFRNTFRNIIPSVILIRRHDVHYNGQEYRR